MKSPPPSSGTTPVLLLCAGYGTRMAGVAGGRPKPLLPVGGRPVLDWLLDQLIPLAGRGAIRVVTNSLHADAFRTWAATAAAPIEVLDDGTRSPDERLGAVGDLAWAVDRLGELPDRMLVAAGDNVFRFPLAPVWERMHRSPGAAVLALLEPDREKLRRTGVLELGADDRVLALHEKPAQPPSSRACPPFYLLGRRDLDALPRYLEAGGSRDEIGRFVAWLAERGTVHAVPSTGRRLDVGDPEGWRAADAELSGSGERM